jgi:putative DNA primase/helicase
LAWLVDGCIAYLENRLGEAKAVRDATETYRAESDLIGQFLAERCEMDAGGKARGSDLFAEYAIWAGQAHVRMLDKNSFAGEIAAKGFEKKRMGDGIVYLGLRVRMDCEEPRVRVTPISFSALTHSVFDDLDRYAV